MSTKLFNEINVKFPKSDEKLEKSYENCKKRRKFLELSKGSYSEHLELAKDDLNSISVDFEKRNWRWVVTKSYYAVFHATNALLVYKLGFFSKDHLCATIALKKENLISEELYKELGNIYERFSDIFGFAVIFEARKLSQYDTEKWKELTEEDAKISWDFAQKFVSFVEGECK
ncbi:HEPN domain-containing protein [Candidatus Woesearchaeota archaeon]|nr:HEPN domain-containing protein [Candidatus Woesearchaeota archaeon]